MDGASPHNRWISRWTLTAVLIATLLFSPSQAAAGEFKGRDVGVFIASSVTVSFIVMVFFQSIRKQESDPDPGEKQVVPDNTLSLLTPAPEWQVKYDLGATQ